MEKIYFDKSTKICTKDIVRFFDSLDRVTKIAAFCHLIFGDDIPDDNGFLTEDQIDRFLCMIKYLDFFQNYVIHEVSR